MRKLRIIGVDTESSLVECEVPDSGEKYTLPLDDSFRAAARGEYISTHGAGRPPVTGSLRPREIQDRIRHGASPEQVATDAGVPLSRIESFAIPVLLERSNAADLARNAHPVLPDGPSLDTLGNKVDIALDTWGIDVDLVKWDAWRERGSGWIVCISWPAGLSDDASATWAFAPDSHGGSAEPLNEEAERMLDPSRVTALRTVAAHPPQPAGPLPVRSVPPLEMRPLAPVPAPAPAERPAPASSPSSSTGSTPASKPASKPAEPAASATPAAAPAADRRPAPATERTADPRPADPRPAPAAKRPVDPRPDAADPRPPATRRFGKPSAGKAASASNSSGANSASSADRARGAADAPDEDDDFLQPTPTEPERKPSSRRHPTMPSWEDVLLGVRSKDD